MKNKGKTFSSVSFVFSKTDLQPKKKTGKMSNAFLYTLVELWNIARKISTELFSFLFRFSSYKFPDIKFWGKNIFSYHNNYMLYNLYETEMANNSKSIIKYSDWKITMTSTWQVIGYIARLGKCVKMTI